MSSVLIEPTTTSVTINSFNIFGSSGSCSFTKFRSTGTVNPMFLTGSNSMIWCFKRRSVVVIATSKDYELGFWDQWLWPWSGSWLKTINWSKFRDFNIPDLQVKVAVFCLRQRDSNGPPRFIRILLKSRFPSFILPWP